MFHKILLIICLSVLSACSSNAVKEPKEIGRQVFAILKELNNDSKEDFIANFMSVEEMRELGENEELVKGTDARNYLTSMSKEEWKRGGEKQYNRIKKQGIKLGIDWDDIQYSDFIYEVREKDGLTLYEGKLYFKANEKLFVMPIWSVFNGKGYQLFDIFRPRLPE